MGGKKISKGGWLEEMPFHFTFAWAKEKEGALQTVYPKTLFQIIIKTKHIINATDSFSKGHSIDFGSFLTFGSVFAFFPHPFFFFCFFGICFTRFEVGFSSPS